MFLIHSGLDGITKESVPTQERSLYMLKGPTKNVLSSSASHLSEWETHDPQYNANPTFIV